MTKYQRYEEEKRMLGQRPLTPEEYLQAVKKLAKKYGV
jgi:hypothetical protein